MPQLPRYSSERQLTTQQPTFLAEGQPGMEFFDQMADFTVRWKKASNKVQETTSQMNFKTGLVDLMNRAENDADYNSYGKYEKELAKLKTDSLKGISDKSIEQELSLNLGYQEKVSQIALQNVFKKKMVAAGQLAATKLIDVEVDNPNDQSEETIKNILAEQVEAGIFDEKTAYNLEKKSLDTMKENMFASDLDSDPRLAKERLESNFYRFDPVKLNREKSRMKAQIELSIKSDAIQTRFDIISSIADNTFDYKNVDELVSKISKTDIDLAEAIKKSKEANGKYVPEFENNDAFASIIRDTFSAGSKEDISKVLVQALKNKNNTEISRDRLAIIVNAALQRSGSLRLTKEVSNGESFDPKQLAIDSGIKSLLSTVGMYGFADAAMHFLKSVASGIMPEKAYSESVSKAIIKNNPDLIKYPDGRIGIDKATGIKYRYFFDGRPREEVK